MARKRREHQDKYQEKIIDVRRVSRKHRGGDRISFSVLAAVGDGHGEVGIALSKAPDVRSAIKKAMRKAKKNTVRVELENGTIPYPVRIKEKAAKMYFKPAPPGTGIAASGTVRIIADLAGINNLTCKSFGSNNPITVAKATITAFEEMET